MLVCLARSNLTMGLTSLLMLLFLIEAAPRAFRRLTVALGGFFRSSQPGAVAPELQNALWTAGIVGVTAVIFYNVYDTHMLFEKEDGTVWTGGSCWADFPIHMHITNSILHGRNSAVSLAGMQSPIFADRPLTYPYLPDFHAAVMMWHGATLRQVYFATGFLSLLALVGLLFSWGTRVTGSRLGSLVGIVCLITLGGVGGIGLLLKDGYNRVLELDPIQDDMVDGTHRSGAIFWFAFLPHVFLPQRGATLAYPLILVVVLLLWQAMKPSPSPASPSMPLSERRTLLMVCAILCALLPLVQAHSFAAMAVFVGTAFLLDAHSWLADLDVLLQAWLPAGFVACVVFAPQWLVFGRMVDGQNHFLEFLPVFRGQAAQAPEAVKAILGQSLLADFIWCWVRAMGPFLPVFLLYTAALAHAPVIGGFKALAAVLAGKEDSMHKLRSAAHRISTGTLPMDLSDGVIAHAAARGVTANGGGFAGAPLTPAAAHKKHDDEAGIQHRAIHSHTGVDSSGMVDPDSMLEDGRAGLPPDEPFGFLSRQLLPRSRGVPRHFEHLVRGPVDETVRAVGGAPLSAAAVAPSAAAKAADPFEQALASVLTINARVQPLLAGLDAVRPQFRPLSAVKFALAALAVFLVGCFVKFQPWDRDNTKIFYIWAMIAAPMVGFVIVSPVVWAMQLISADPRESEADAEAEAIAAVAGESPDGEDDADDAPALGKMDTTQVQERQQSVFRSRFLFLPLLLVGVPLMLAVLVAGSTSGVLSLIREFGMFHELYGPLEKEVGEFIIHNVPAKSVMVHDNNHRCPAGYLAGRPSLAGYDGWLWSHGYDYGERHNDRNFIMERVTDLQDRAAYDKMRRWGVRYVLGENKATHEGSGDGKDMFGDGNVKRIFMNDRWQVFEVLGYGFPPT